MFAFSYERAFILTKMLVLSVKSTDSVLLCAFDKSFLHTRKLMGHQYYIMPKLWGGGGGSLTFAHVA